MRSVELRQRCPGFKQARAFQTGTITSAHTFGTIAMASIIVEALLKRLGLLIAVLQELCQQSRR